MFKICIQEHYDMFNTDVHFLKQIGDKYFIAKPVVLDWVESDKFTEPFLKISHRDISAKELAEQFADAIRSMGYPELLRVTPERDVDVMQKHIDYLTTQNSRLLSMLETVHKIKAQE